MATRRNNIEFAARNYATADAIYPQTVREWDDGLWRGPRLLVPSHMEALVVTPEEAETLRWARVKFNPDALPGYREAAGDGVATGDEEAQPAPFETYTGVRPAGVHLHWSLPDGLTQGKQTGPETGELDPSVDASRTESPEDEVPEDTEFPPIPDRWLVVRMYPGSSATAKRRAAAWVIESEERDPDKRKTPLPDWREDRSDEAAHVRWLTVLGEGDPAFTAYYDNVQHILGFHDPLDGVSHGPVSYLVTGWYSRAEDDPLHAPDTSQAWLDKLAEMGWSLGDEDESAIRERLADAAEEARKRLSDAGLVARVDDAQDYAISVTNVPQTDLHTAHETPYGSAYEGARKTAYKSAGMDSDAASNAVGKGARFYRVDDSTRGAFQFQAAPAIGAIAAAVGSMTWSDQYIFRNYWPRQTLCHAALYDILWNGVGGSYDRADAGPPVDDAVSLAIGNTGIEALAALVARQRNKPNLEKILAAFHYDLLSEIQDPDGLAQLESLLHAEDFESKPGGFVVDTIEQGDLFPRDSGDVARDVVHTTDYTLPAYPVSQAVAAVASSDLLASAVAIDTHTATAANRAADASEVSSDALTWATDTRAESQWRDNYGGPGIRVDKSYETQPLRAQKGSFVEATANIAASVDDIIRGATQTQRPRKTVAFRRAQPRYWEPQEPVILLKGAGRSCKHGEDSKLSDDGKLPCRITGETVRGINPTVAIGTLVGKKTQGSVRTRITVANIATDDLRSGQLPIEVGHLYAEAVLLDQTNAPLMADVMLGQKQRGEIDKMIQGASHLQNVQVQAITRESAELKAQVEQTLLWNRYVDPVVDSQALAAVSGLEGKPPVPFALAAWQRPWTPLHLDWEVEWIPTAGLERGWTLGENDFKPRQSAEDAAAESAAGQPISGRTLLTPAVAEVLADTLTKFLEEERDGADEATPAQEQALAEIRDAIRNLDLIATRLDGFNDWLLGQVKTHRFFAEGEDSNLLSDSTTARDGAEPQPLRAGHLRILRLRVVDAFGQFHDVSDNRRDNAIKAADMRSSAHPELVRLPPRIVQPSRLMFRMLNAQDDQLDATKNNTPICGWILPDHLDEALETYDASGENQGQIQWRKPRVADPRDARLEWQGVPGKPGPFGGMPQLGTSQRHLQDFLDGLLAQGLLDSQQGTGTDARSESALAALLRMIDATLWTVDSIGREGDEHLSVLVGRPLALVRAKLELQMETAPLTDELARRPLPVRLGALTRLGDGLMGYFIKDDYSQFYPVHESIAEQNRPSRPQQGFLGAIQTVEGYYQGFHNHVTPVTHPYINRDPVIYIRPGQTVMLTLLVDPRGAVHATSGILPRKRIELMREHVANALANMSMTFRVGPVLTDPETIRMPLPTEIPGNWSWVNRTGPTVWQEGTVVTATDDAKFGDEPAMFTEGWLKLSEAMGGKKSGV